jgi:hypothetical protein
VLEKSWTRVAALGILIFSATIFFIHDLNVVGRRVPWIGGSRLMAATTRFDRVQGAVVECNWGNGVSEKLFLHDEKSSREGYETFLAKISQPCTFGVLGSENEPGYFYLFGKGFQNRVTSLVDARKPYQAIEPPRNTDFLVISPGVLEWKEWAAQRGYFFVFEMKHDQAGFAVFESKGSAREAQAFSFSNIQRGSLQP